MRTVDKRIIVTILIAMIALFFTACAGGGSSDNSNIPPIDSNNKTTLSGYVVDDPVVGATIEVYDENGKLLAREENATDVNGKFEIDLSDTNLTNELIVKAIKDNIYLTNTINSINSEVYVTHYTTAVKKLIDYFNANGFYSKKNMGEIKKELNFQDGIPNNNQNPYFDVIYSIAKGIHNSIDENRSYNISEESIKTQTLKLSNGSIYNFSVNNFTNVKCETNPDISFQDSILSVHNAKESHSLMCSAKKDTTHYVFNITINSAQQGSISMSSNKRIVNLDGVTITKPSDDEISVKSISNAPVLTSKNDATIIGNTLLDFSPSGLQLAKPLTVQIPSQDDNLSFYLSDMNGGLSKVGSNYSDGTYLLKIPHFSKLIAVNNYLNEVANSVNRVSYDTLKEKLLKDDTDFYKQLGNGNYAPKLLTADQEDLKNNTNIKALLELLVFKNGKDLINFDGSSLTFTPNGIKVSYASSSENSSFQQEVDALSKAFLLLSISSYKVYDKIEDFQKYIDFRKWMLSATTLDKALKISELLDEQNKNATKTYLNNPGYTLRMTQIETLGNDIIQNYQKYKALDNYSSYGINRKVGHLLSKILPEVLSDNIAKKISPALQALSNGKLTEFSNKISKVISTGGFALSTIVTAAKYYSIGISYNFDKIENKIKFLESLKKVLPDYAEDIEEVINELKDININKRYYLSWLNAYKLYFKDFTNDVDFANDILGFGTNALSFYNIFKNSAKLDTFLNSKGLGWTTAILDGANSIAKATSTWQGGNSLAYLSATASTAAYEAVNNSNLTSKEQLKFYAIFQSLSNYSLVSWYYYSGAISQKDNLLYELGNILDIGISIASSSVSTGNIYAGLSDGILKALLNEQIVATVWDCWHHSCSSFSHEASETDRQMANYLSRNAIYRMYATGQVDSLLANKTHMSLPLGNTYELSDGSKILTLFIKKDQVDKLSIRFNRDNSNLYYQDIALGKDTHATTTAYDFNDKKSYYPQTTPSLFGAFTNIGNNSGLVTIVAGKNISSIEILGWNTTEEKTVPYYDKIDLNNIVVNNYNNDGILKIESDIEEKTGETLYYPSSDINSTKIYNYAKNEGFIFFDISSGKVNNNIKNNQNWLAIKYYNLSYKAVIFAKVNNNIYYYIKDYISGQEKETLKTAFPGMPDILHIPHNPSDLLKEINTQTASFSCYYLENIFPKLNDAIEWIYAQIAPIKDINFTVVDTNQNILPLDNYYDKNSSTLYLDNSIDSLTLTYSFKRNNLFWTHSYDHFSINDKTDYSYFQNNGIDSYINDNGANEYLEITIPKSFLQKNKELNVSLFDENNKTIIENNIKVVGDMQSQIQNEICEKGRYLSCKMESNTSIISFNYNYPGENCSINFHDGSDEVSLDSCEGTITHVFKKPYVYFVELKSNDEVVEHIGVTVENEDSKWIGFVSSLYGYQEPNENYSNIVSYSNGLYIPPSLSDKSYYWTNFRLVKPSLFKDISADDCTIRIKLKVPYDEGGIEAYDVGLSILGNTGYQGWVTFMGASWGQSWDSIGAVNSSNRDLSELVQDFSDWKVIELHTHDHIIDAYYEGSLVYSVVYKGDIGTLYGIKQSFKGSGSIAWIEVYDNKSNRLVYKKIFISDGSTTAGGAISGSGGTNAGGADF